MGFDCFFIDSGQVTLRLKAQFMIMFHLLETGPLLSPFQTRLVQLHWLFRAGVQPIEAH